MITKNMTVILPESEYPEAYGDAHILAVPVIVWA